MIQYLLNQQNDAKKYDWLYAISAENKLKQLYFLIKSVLILEKIRDLMRAVLTLLLLKNSADSTILPSYTWTISQTSTPFYVSLYIHIQPIQSFSRKHYPQQESLTQHPSNKPHDRVFAAANRSKQRTARKNPRSRFINGSCRGRARRTEKALARPESLSRMNEISHPSGARVRRAAAAARSEAARS